MKLLQRTVGAIETNCYLLLDEASGAAALIDPGDEANVLLAALEEANADLRAVFLTHGHYDHVSAVPALRERFPDLAVYLHALDTQGVSNLFPLMGLISGVLTYGEGDRIPLGNLSVSVLHTPGHSRGSVTLAVEDALFTGDTLFADSCGRTDLYGGDQSAMYESLARLALLEGDYRVFPGHGPASTLAHERENNPFVRFAVRHKK